nr:hypothetical protein [Tanacetum cinerariifolium]
SQVSDKVKIGLGYEAASPAKESFVKSSEMLENHENVRSKKGYHAVPSPYTGNYIPPKSDLIFINEQVESESLDVVSNVSSSAVKTVESKVESVDVKNKGKLKTTGTPVNTVRPVNNADSKPIMNSSRSISNAFKRGYSQAIRPFNKYSAYKKTIFNKEQKEYKEKGLIDSGCSRHMTGNKCCLTDYEDYDGGFVSFGDGKGKISRKGKIKTGTLDIDDVYFYKELKRLGYINYKTMNKLVKGNLVRGIKREFSVARTPQQNSVAERKNRTLIEAVRTMALVIKPHNKTPYELIRGRPPLIDFMKPFGSPVTILYTKDYLGKFDKKANEGFFIGYSMVSKVMRVINKKTRIVEETLNIIFLKNAPNVKENRLDWLFDIDSLTISMNYVPVVAGFQTNGIVGTKDNIVAGQAEKNKEPEQEYILIPICTTYPLISQCPKDSVVDSGKKATEVHESQVSDNGGLPVNTARPSFVNAASPSPINATGTPASIEEEVDMNNVVSSYTIPDAPLTKLLKDHPKEQVIGSIETPVQIRQMTKINKEHGLISSVQKLRRTNHKDFQNCLFACYLSQMDPKKPVQALKDLNKWVIGTKWVFRNKKDERCIVIKNKARLVTQGHTQEEGIDYDEGLQVQQKSDGIFISQEKYVVDILKKFDFSTIKTAITLMEPNKALVKDAEAKDVDVKRIFRYLKFDFSTARFQVTPKTSHLYAVKRIFRYLEGQPTLGLWYPRDSPFDLEAYSDSDYASLDRKSITGEYVAAASCSGHVLWIQNQMLDYGFNLMNTTIYIDNESTIYIVKDPVFHSKTKHIVIRHHFIRDSYEKKLIQVIKIAFFPPTTCTPSPHLLPPPCSYKTLPFGLLSLPPPTSTVEIPRYSIGHKKRPRNFEGSDLIQENDKELKGEDQGAEPLPQLAQETQKTHYS